MKKTKTLKVEFGRIRISKEFRRIWQNPANSAFFSSVIDQFKHYTNPVAYEKDGYFYLLTQKPFVDAVDTLGEEEILLDVIDLKEEDVIQFLAPFLSKEYLHPKTVAQLIVSILEYTKTKEGRRWYDTICESHNQTARLSALLGISSSAVKAYLHLIKPGREKYLKKLDDTESANLYSLYEDSRSNERATKEGTAETSHAKPSAKDDSTSNCETGESNSDSTAPYEAAADQVVRASSCSAAAAEPVVCDNVVNPNAGIFKDELANYKNSGNNNIALNGSSEKFVVRITAFLNDGSRLELDGKIDLIVDGKSVRSTANLRKSPEGIWNLPKYDSLVALTIYPENASSLEDEIIAAA